MSIRVTVFPTSSKNPYVANFYRGVESNGVQILDAFKGDFPKNADVLHIQWPEAWMWSEYVERRRKSLKYILLSVSKRKLFGLKVVNTVHNLRPHNKQTCFQKIVYWYILRNCDGFIHLSEAGRELFLRSYPWAKSKAHTVIYHPSYRAQLSDLTKNKAREKLGIDSSQLRIVFFGRVSALQRA